MKLVWLIAAISMCGCTTMATVVPADTQAAIDKLHTGDRVGLRTAAGWHEGLRILSVDPASIRVQNGGEPEAFARSDVTAIQVRRRAPGKTIALAAGIFVLGQAALCGNPFDHEGRC